MLQQAPSQAVGLLQRPPRARLQSLHRPNAGAAHPCWGGPRRVPPQPAALQTGLRRPARGGRWCPTSWLAEPTHRGLRASPDHHSRLTCLTPHPRAALHSRCMPLAGACSCDHKRCKTASCLHSTATWSICSGSHDPARASIDQNCSLSLSFHLTHPLQGVIFSPQTLNSFCSGDVRFVQATCDFYEDRDGPSPTTTR